MPMVSKSLQNWALVFKLQPSIRAKKNSVFFFLKKKKKKKEFFAENIPKSLGLGEALSP